MLETHVIRCFKSKTIVHLEQQKCFCCGTSLLQKHHAPLEPSDFKCNFKKILKLIIKKKYLHDNCRLKRCLSKTLCLKLQIQMYKFGQSIWVTGFTSSAVNWTFCNHLPIVNFDIFSFGAGVIIKLLISIQIKNRGK